MSTFGASSVNETTADCTHVSLHLPTLWNGLFTSIASFGDSGVDFVTSPGWTPTRTYNRTVAQTGTCHLVIMISLVPTKPTRQI